MPEHSRFSPSGLTIPETAEEKLKRRITDSFRLYVEVAEALPAQIGRSVAITDELEVELFRTIFALLPE